MGVSSDIQFLDARNEVVHAYASHAKVRDVFDLPDTEVSVEEGIHRMTDWAKAHGPRQSKHFDNIEVLKNMPPSWRAEFGQ
jgi:UDP-glucose 4-epimerase